MGRKKKEPTEVIRIPTSKKPMVKSILTMGIEGWCNSMTEKGICFLCGLKFKKCTCGTRDCRDIKENIKSSVSEFKKSKQKQKDSGVIIKTGLNG